MQRLGLRNLLTATTALLASGVLALPAAAQVGRAYPGQMYATAVEELYEGDYDLAERFLRREVRGAVRVGASRWVDSICFGAMLGETLYQRGQLDQALEQFDGVIDLLLDNPAWLSQINFQQPLREDIAIGRRVPPWARPTRQVVYADVPQTFLYQAGRLNNSAAAQTGGVVQAAQFWKLNAEEVAYTTAWALYRRGQLLGPLGAYDKRRTDRLVSRFAAGGIGDPEHWSSAWVDLWQGLAKASTGDVLEAKPYLDRALLLAGRLEHRAGGIGLLALGRLTAGQDAAGAATLFAEALASGIAFDEPGLVAEATQALHELAVITGQTPPPPAVEVADWAGRRGRRHVAITAQLAMAEAALLQGDMVAPGALFQRAPDVAAGLLGREAERLTAMLAAGDDKMKEPLDVATQAVAGYLPMSRRLMQLRVALTWFNDGRLSLRQAREAFGKLLDDPSLVAWATTPLDGLASSVSPATEAFNAWFAAAVDRRDAMLAMRVIDLQRRREFFATQPLGGRLTAVRWLLEAPDAALPGVAVEARAKIEAAFPAYRAAQLDRDKAIEELREELADKPEQLGGGKRFATRLQRAVAQQERLVLAAAMSRLPTPLVYPPPIDPIAAKAAIAPGEVLLAFDVWQDDLYGVRLSRDGEQLWRIDKVSRVADLVDRLLTEVAGATVDSSWSIEELKSSSWADAARRLDEVLLAGSGLDPSSMTQLRVCPAGPLWRAPFALLMATTAPEGDDLAVVTHAPTPGWAVRARSKLPATPGRPATWLAKVEKPMVEPPWGDDPVARVAAATPMLEGLDAMPLVKSLADRVVFDASGVPLGADTLELQLTRGPKGARSLGSWVALPRRGPRVATLLGLGGDAKRPRRRNDAAPLGDPEFHILSALLAGGSDTLLIEKWPTGGARSRELIAEWLVGLGRLSPADAWRRSVMLARGDRLDPDREPRLALEPGDNPAAEHPFWWAGYVLVD